MLRVFKIIVLSIVLVLVIPNVSSANEYTKLNDLVEKGKELNGKTITIKAEAIGEPLARGKFTWVNVNDGTNVIGIWMDSNEAKKIYKYGNYKSKGDVIEVRGTFSRDCKEHGGDVDIHADSFQILEKGYDKNISINNTRKNISIILMISTILLGVVYYKKGRC